MISVLFNTGEALTFEFRTDPYYYHSSSENHFSFSCDYNAPIQEVNLKFPDDGCAPFSLLSVYVGQSSYVVELSIADIYPIYDGSTLSLSLSTILIFPQSVASCGESLSVILSQTQNIDFICYTGQSGSSTVVIPISATLSSDSYTGQYAVSSLSVYQVLSLQPISGESGSIASNGFILLPFSFLGISNGYTDENCQTILSVSQTLSTSAYTGQNTYSTLQTSLSFDLGFVSFYTGENYNLSIYVVDRYVSGSGESLSLSLDVPVVNRAFLSATQIDGHVLSIGLQTNSRLSLLAVSGETLSSVVTTRDPVVLSLSSFYTGESGVVEYRMQASLSATFLDGSNASSVLDAHPSGPIGILTAYSGETGYLSISTTMLLYISGGIGEVLIPTLQSRPQVAFSIPAICGENLYIQNLSTTTKVPSYGSSGEWVKATLTTFASSGLSLDGYTGENSPLQIQTFFQLSFNYARDGETASISSMVFDPNYIGSNGQSSTFTLATSTVVSQVFTEGNRLSLSLDTHPPFSIGEFKVGCGESLILSLEALRTVFFRVNFTNDSLTQLDIDSATYFDLSSDKCCGIRPNAANNVIELKYVRHPAEISGKNPIICSFSLATRPRFSFTCYAGERFNLIDNTPYFSFDFTDTGRTSDIRFDTTDYRHRLCKGYFIPNGNWIAIELNEIIDEACKANKCWTGQTLDLTLSTNQAFEIVIPVGEVMTPYLTTYDPWHLFGWIGEIARIDFPMEAKPVFRTGEYGSFRFYEPDWIGGAGEHGVTDLITEYGVEFLEIGCFDNEFVYQNRDGDKIAELFNPVPIEGDPFLHSIKARCF